MKWTFYFSLFLIALSCSKKGEEQKEKQYQHLECDFSKGKPSQQNIYAEGKVVFADIQIAPKDWKTLLAEKTTDKEPKDKYTYFKGNLTFNGGKYENIGVRKRSKAGSFSTIFPSIALKSTKFFKGKKKEAPYFSGKRKDLVFNNSITDPSKVKQCMTYKVFREEEVPSPLCNFVALCVNNKYYGVYVNVEKINKSFLKRNFQESKGALFEADIPPTDLFPGQLAGIDPKNKKAERQRDLLEKTAAHLQSTFEEKNLDKKGALEEVVNYENLLSFLALEILFNHNDGMSKGRNNYYFYHDQSERFSFIPWGMDNVFYANGFITKGNTAAVLPKIIFSDPVLESELVDRIFFYSKKWIGEKKINKIIDEYAEEIRPYLLGHELDSWKSKIDNLKFLVNDRINSLEKEGFCRKCRL